MRKKKAKQRRAGFRAGETKAAGRTLEADLIIRSRKLVMLQAKRRAQLKAVERTDTAIKLAKVELATVANAAVNERVIVQKPLPATP